MELLQKYKTESKHYLNQSNIYLNLIKELECGVQLEEILPKLLEKQIIEINETTEKYENKIEDLKLDYENKIKEIELERDHWKYKHVEEFLSDTDDYSSDEDF